MKTCERCGTEFGCQPEKSEQCWCMSIGKLRPLPSQYQDCLCPKCLKVFSLTAEVPKSGDLVEGEDFYLEKGLMVFTREYHLKRGYCCNSGCRHCAYR